MSTATYRSALAWSLRVWRVSLPIGLVLGLLFALRDYTMSAGSSTPLPLWYWTVGEMAVFLFWSVVTPLVLFIMNRFPLEKGVWTRNVMLHLGLYCSLAAAYSVYYLYVDNLLLPGPQTNFLASFPRTFSVAFSDGLTKYYGPILIAGYIAVYYSRLRGQELHAANLESQLAQAQLRALKMQIQPHFLFNTLHSISTLVYTDAKRADRMIAELSDLLRLTLEDQDFVPLSQEIEYVKKYLAIEQIRFSHRLSVHFAVQPESLNWRIPHLLLQPIVENSVKHGISKKLKRGRISVAVFEDDTWLRIKISDNGQGIVPENPENRARERLGLKNTKERLEQVYHGNFKFFIHSEKDFGTVVDIYIPRQDDPSIPKSGMQSYWQLERRT